jgi:hypothetical protein
MSEGFLDFTSVSREVLTMGIRHSAYFARAQNLYSYGQN